MPEVKEPNHFGADTQDIDFNRFRDESDYLELFAGATTQKRIGEATPLYLRSPEAARQIWEFDPAAKIIIMLREPVDLLYSNYWHYRSTGRETARSLAEAMANEQDEQQQQDSALVAPIYRELPCFSEHVRRYMEQFGRENVLVILMDDLKHDTAAVYRQALEFLDLDPTFQPDFKIVNAGKQVRSEALQRLLVKLNLTPLQIKNSAAGYVASRIIPRPLRQAGVQAFRQLYASERKPPPIDPEFRQRIQAEYRAEVEALSILLERDLSHWRGEQAEN
jgi:hypothetical protein